MEIKTNQKNADGQYHGYYQDSLVEKHYYNGLKVGYETYNRNLFYKWLCHYINGKEIGCEVMANSQYFFKIPGVKFGEKIRWK